MRHGVVMFLLFKQYIILDLCVQTAYYFLMEKYVRIAYIKDLVAVSRKAAIEILKSKLLWLQICLLSTEC